MRSKIVSVHRLAVALILASSLLSPVAAATPEYTWTSIGPVGGDITALAIDPRNTNTLYAGTRGGGVFKTTDGGRTWRASNDGLREAVATLDLPWFVTALAIDPRTPTTLYAATEVYGVFKSIDGGANWRTSPLGDVTALTIDPNTPGTLYAGTKSRGVYKSRDGGQSWRAINSGLPSLPIVRFGTSTPTYPRINTLVVDPRTPTTLYAGLSQGSGSFRHPDGGLFRSTDGGISWRAINTGLDNPGADCCPLVVDPQTSTTLYTGTREGAVLMSDDGGEAWRAMNTGITARHVIALTSDLQTPTTLYTCVGRTSTDSACGIFKSTDRGQTWLPLNAGQAEFNLAVLIIDPRNPKVLYAGTRTGVFKSTDGGDRWRASNTGLANLDVYSMVVDPKRPTTLYAASRSRLFKSTNGGRTWRVLDVAPTDLTLSALAIDPRTPTTLYLGTVATYYEAGRGVFKSTDAGQSWRAVTTGLTNLSLSVSVLTVDPMTPTTVYAALRTRDGQVPEGDARLIKSTDGGETWRYLRFGPGNLIVTALVIDPQVSTALFAAAISGPPFTSEAGVFKSTDGGETWRSANTGLPRYLDLVSLAIDPQTSTNLYAGALQGLGEPGIFKSSDGGATWQTLGGGLLAPEVTALAVDPRTPAVVYAGARRSGVFKSTDGGLTWHALNAGLASLRITELILDPNDPTTIYAATAGNGVFVLRQR